MDSRCAGPYLGGGCYLGSVALDSDTRGAQGSHQSRRIPMGFVTLRRIYSEVHLKPFLLGHKFDQVRVPGAIREHPSHHNDIVGLV